VVNKLIDIHLKKSKARTHSGEKDKTNGTDKMETTNQIGIKKFNRHRYQPKSTETLNLIQYLFSKQSE
jgi:hypothetical protein